MANLGIRGKFFANLFERTHPGDSQVTILQHDPVAGLLSISDCVLSLLTLTLTKGDWLYKFLLKISELLQRIHGVRAG